ncbi:MAG TPA: HlyD family type I secretion periplasmic adaptor subunit [Xanthobacteraceae bacterium]|nr:HlyD family type I secretion periplasmic adaptor subunit [Xanthobacteraceae bacterium]
MQQSSVRQTDRMRRLRGRHTSQGPSADDAAILNDRQPRAKRAGRPEIVTKNSSRGYESIAVVVGKPSDSRAGLSRIPALHYSTASQTVTRTVTAALKRAYGAIFNPNDSHWVDAADGEGLKAYLIRSFEGQRRAGGRVMAIALVAGGGWASFVPISGAVIIPGTVVSETSVKKIQHPTGGIVAGISVKDGTHVRKGDILVSLDGTQVRSSFQVVAKQLEEVRARIARLTAERDGRDDQALIRKAALEKRTADNEQLLTSESSLFEARANARRSQRELLRNRIAQLNEEIAGLEAQIKSKQTQSDLIAQELEGVQTLYEKRLIPLTRLTSLQREAARLDGERGQLVSTIAETRSKISESELQLVKLEQDFRADVMKDLREAQDKEAELTERVVAAKDQVAHIDLRAPVTGIVHQLAVHTIGGVVTPAEVMMVIVPEADELQIDARLPANEIDQVHKGQNTLVRFSAFNQRTTPELRGIVSHVSADITRDPQSNAGYYTVRVSLPGGELARLGELQLISGMPAEVFIQTGSRTMVSYLFKPISDQLQRMFRER